MSALSKSRAVNVRREDSKRIEDETRKMEAKLDVLRKTMDAAAETAKANAEGGRWRSGSSSKPIRGYVKQVLEAPAKTKSRDKTQKLAAAQPTRAAASVDCAPASGTVGDFLAAGNQTQKPLSSAEVSPVKHGAAGGGAATNLQAAMNQQNEDAQEVESFLAGLKLDRYVSLFMDNGFESMDVVMEMQESHMREIGMAVGHIVKLRKKLTELRPASPAAKPVGPSSSTTGSSLQKKVSFGATEAREIVQTPAKSSTATASTDLKAGEFDEAESAASFQEALRAWRGGGKPDVVAETLPATPTKPGSFWSTVGGDEVDLQRCSTPLNPPTAGTTTDTETQQDLVPSEEKLCCYNCYKQFYKQFAVGRADPLSETGTPRSAMGASSRSSKRLLCSEACADRWVASMEEKAKAQRKRQEKLESLREAQRAFELQQAGGGVGAAA